MRKRFAKLLLHLRQWIRGEEHRTFRLSRPSEDDARKTYLLRIILAGIIPLSFTAMVYVAFSLIVPRKPIATAPVLFMLGINVVFTALFILSKKRRMREVRGAFVWIVFCIATYASWKWGVNLPIGFLAYGLAITFAGILLNRTAAIKVVVATVFSLFVLFYLQDSGIHQIAFSWKNSETVFMDIVIYSGVLGIIGITSWLSNREIEKSLEQRDVYASSLKQERDSLENRVQERTRELRSTYEEFRNMQKEKFIEMNNLAALGKITTGLLHDIANPLTYASLSAQMEKTSKTRKTKHINNILGGLREISEMIESTRKQVQKSTNAVLFYPAKEIKRACTFLQYEARKKRVFFVFLLQKGVRIFGDSAKFYQCVSNIVLNAIEAYPPAKQHTKQRTITIQLTTTPKQCIVEVTDRAGGIPKAFRKYIFEPFFTTKDPKHGTGIGLAATKETIERLFNGKLSFRTTDGIGTTFRIELPLTRATTHSRNSSISPEHPRKILANSRVVG